MIISEALEELKKEIHHKDEAIEKLEMEMKQLELKISEFDGKDVTKKASQTQEVENCSEVLRNNDDTSEICGVENDQIIENDEDNLEQKYKTRKHFVIGMIKAIVDMVECVLLNTPG